MLISKEREKLINAIVYFASHTKYCGKVKLFKLLYLFDFDHFRETGRSATGLDYSAWRLGPVPVEIMQEWDQLDPDLASAIDIVPEQVIDYVREKVVPKRPFDDSAFTKRELRMMKDLAQRFRDEMTRPLVNFTHAELGPWHKIWDSGRGSNERIPYALAVREDDPNAEAMLEWSREYEGILTADARQH
jgi:uncharacterized phage-associated protein